MGIQGIFSIYRKNSTLAIGNGDSQRLAFNQEYGTIQRDFIFPSTD
jgi:hypothetical protein